MKLPTEQVGRSSSDLGGSDRGGERRRLWLRLAGVYIVVSVLLAVVVAVRFHIREREAIQGKWTTVSVEGSGFRVGSKWEFFSNGVIDCPVGRFHYSIIPLLHTIEWGNAGNPEAMEAGTYELDEDSLKIWLYREKSQNLLYVLKRVSPKKEQKGK
ncbi:MAG TPA: hypothetical protein VGI40_28330 [Pirellulaceae bacterium]